MLVHRDSRPYEVAASETRNRALDKLNEMIEQGQEKAQQVVEQVFSEIPVDHLPQGNTLTFSPSETGVDVTLLDKVVSETVTQRTHKHALNQIAERASFPRAYTDHLLERGEWGRQLLADNLNRLYTEDEKLSNTNFLVRSVNDEVRGFLSQNFRRIDARPLLENFLDAVVATGARIYTGYALDTKVAVKAIIPVVYEPVPNEIVGFGLDWSTSDFGAGANVLAGFIWRAWCTNLAVTSTEIRQIHLGKRLDESMVYSKETYELDTKATASALKDAVKVALNPERVEQYCEAIRKANEQQIDAGKAIQALKKQITQAEAESIRTAYNTPHTELLPLGDTKWRLSNAVSLVANNTENRDRARDLMKIAGAIIS